MKKLFARFGFSATAGGLLISAQLAPAQGTAFTYQGQLQNNGSPANGLYDFRFKLYVDPLGNTQVGASYLTNAIPATNGLFETTVDFGAGLFNGSNYWLEVDVKTNGFASYTDLSPLQRVTPTPYAIFATTASNVSGTVYAGQLNGMVANGNLPSSPTVAGTVTAGSFAGNGANVTNVNAAALNGLTSASFWQTNGNAGANPANGAFLGTTDTLPLELRVSGVRALRLEPDFSGQGAPNVIGGSPVNYVAAGIYGATIGGGGTTNDFQFYGVYLSNSVTGDFGAVGGGQGNSANTNSTVGGGLGNAASGEGATVGGGAGNTADYYYATVGGGWRNTASGEGAAVAGGGWEVSASIGYGNTSSGQDSFVGAGNKNIASGDYAMVGAGFQNEAENSGDTVPGGFGNIASGGHSFAAGTGAQALHLGAFVWADSQEGVFASTTNNQFLIRAQGGVGIGTNNPGTALDVNGTVTAASFLGGSIGLGLNPVWAVDVQASQAVARLTTTNNGNGAVIELKNTTSGAGSLGAINFNNGTNGYPGQIAYAIPDALNFRVGGVNRMTLDSAGLTVNGTFVSSSDRNLKQDFRPVDSRSVLEKVSRMPVQTWAYKEDPGTKHLGPMAQDFYAAFGTGADDKHIAVVDEGGVALAAIQGLNQKLEAETKAKDAEIEKLKAKADKVDALEKQLNELKQMVQSLAEKK